MSAATRDPVAEALRCIVREKGLVQKKVAERAGLKYQDLNRTLHGRRPLLARELPALAAACGVTVEEVYERAEELQQLMETDGARGQGGPA